MADGDNNSANTVLISVVILIIIALAFFFGFRGNWGGGAADNASDVNVELNTPDVGGGDSGGAAQ